MIGFTNMDTQNGMKMLIRLCAILKRNLRSFKSMDRLKMGAILAWHSARHQVAYVMQDGKVIAIGIARGVRSMTHARDAYHVDDNSDMVWVDWAVCKNKKALPSLLVALRCRFPNVRHIVFSRQKTNHQIRKYDFDRFLKLSNIGVSYGR